MNRRRLTGMLGRATRWKPPARDKRVAGAPAPRRAPTVSELLALLGLVGALVAGFLWASTTALHNAFFGFFSAPRFASPVGYEDMIYQGALNQLSNLLWVSVAVWIVWMFWSSFNDSAHPKLIQVRDGVVDFVNFLSPLLWLGVLWVILYALKDAELKGVERARQLASGAEDGTAVATLIRRKVGEQTVTVEGFQLGCSERFCALYQPSATRTGPGAKTAAGTTVLVPLDSLLSMAIATRGPASATTPSAASSTK